MKREIRDWQFSLFVVILSEIPVNFNVISCEIAEITCIGSEQATLNRSERLFREMPKLAFKCEFSVNMNSLTHHYSLSTISIPWGSKLDSFLVEVRQVSMVGRLSTCSSHSPFCCQHTKQLSCCCCCCCCCWWWWWIFLSPPTLSSKVRSQREFPSEARFSPNFSAQSCEKLNKSL